MIAPLFHVLVLAVNGFTLWYDQQYVEIPSPVKDKADKMPMKGRLMYLTFWCVILHTIYFTISLLNDLLGSNDAAPRRTPLIRKLKDYIFSMTFPVAVYVTLTFWGLYHFDKDLIFPDSIAAVFPVWFNHALHTFVFVFILIEMLVTNRQYPPRKVGVAIIVVFNLTYIAWMHILHDRLGVWAYPIFEILNLPMRVAFLSVAVLLALSFYVLGEKLNGILSPTPKRSAEPKKKRK